MAIVLVRHTQPAVAPGLCYGQTDLALADSFEEEAQGVLAGIATAPSVLLTSPLKRCRLLAQRIGATFDREPEVQPAWIEMDFGTWEGKPWEAIPREALDAWAGDFHGFNGHGGESVAQLETRIRRALELTPEGALVVTHAGTIKAALAIAGQGAGWDAKPAFGEAVTLRR